MRIDILQVGYLSTNCYILTTDNSNEAVVIDPGASYERIKEKLDSCGKKVAAVLLTHGHFDHTGAVNAFQKDGAKVYAHSAEFDMLYDGSHSKTLGLNYPPIVPDVALKGGEEIKIAAMTFNVIHTAGHSKGGVCYLSGGNLFCGDTIFFEDYGRTDLTGGDFNELKQTIIEKIFTLPDNTVLYPGHGDASSVGHEKQFNSIIADK
jgi:glyoxylase-like metal-dependent hydrolase (beta-lactamase superfamily II)